MQIVVMLLVSLFFFSSSFWKEPGKVYWFVDNSLIQPVQKYDSLQAQGDWQKNAA